MSAHAAILGAREVDAEGSIALVSEEPDPPYNRPPLSKALWKGKTVDSIWRKEGLGAATLHLGRTIRALDMKDRKAADDDGETYRFDKLLLATGGTVRRLPFAGAGIIYYRTLADYRVLRALCEKGQKFTVIGGGFIGSEIAAALVMNGKRVTMVFPEESIGSRVYPAALARFLVEYFREKGVEVLAGEAVAGVERTGERSTVTTKSGRRIEADGVVAGIGITPNTALAEAAGLKVSNGIEVDEFMRTSHPDAYAAGDVANFYNAALGKRMRVEHEDNANTMGRQAGRNMAGAGEPYRHLPAFYSDLFELGYEAVGEVDAGLETVEDWKVPNREGVVYYLKDGRVRGVLLWNVWNQLEAARTLVASPGPFLPRDLVGRVGGR